MKINLAILFIFTFVSIQAQGIQFFKGSVEEVLMESKKQDKPIFVDAYTTWCGPCKWMAKNTFTDEKIGEFMSNNFISYKLDMEKGEGLKFADKFKVRAYPTLIVIDHNEQLLHKAIGALNPTQFYDFGMASLDEESRLGTVLAKYEAGNRDEEFLVQYYRTTSKAGVLDQKQAEEYLATLSKEQMGQEDNLMMIIDMVNDVQHPGFEYVINNADEIAEAHPEWPSLDNFIKQKYVNALYNAKSKNIGSAKDVMSVMDKRNYPNKKQVVLETEIKHLSAQENINYKKMTQKLDELFKDPKASSANYRNAMAWNYYENRDKLSKDQIASAIQWSKQSLDLDRNYASADTYAALIFASGDYEMGVKAAKEAISLAEESATDYSGTSQLIEQFKK